MLKIRLASSSNYVQNLLGLVLWYFWMLGLGTSYCCWLHFCMFTCTVGEYSTLGLTIFRSYMR